MRTPSWPWFFLAFFLALFLQPLLLRHVQSPHGHSLSSTVDSDELDETSDAAHGSGNVPRPAILRLGLHPPRFTGDWQVDEVKIPYWAISGSGQVEAQDSLRQINEESLALEGEHDFKCKGTHDLRDSQPLHPPRVTTILSLGRCEHVENVPILECLVTNLLVGRDHPSFRYDEELVTATIAPHRERTRRTGVGRVGVWWAGDQGERRVVGVVDHVVSKPGAPVDEDHEVLFHGLDGGLGEQLRAVRLIELRERAVLETLGKLCSDAAEGVLGRLDVLGRGDVGDSQPNDALVEDEAIKHLLGVLPTSIGLLARAINNRPRLTTSLSLGGRLLRFQIHVGLQHDPCGQRR
jgi:hypothetical protein